MLFVATENPAKISRAVIYFDLFPKLYPWFSCFPVMKKFKLPKPSRDSLGMNNIAL